MKLASKRRSGVVVAVLGGLALALTSTTAHADEHATGTTTNTPSTPPDAIAHRGSSGMAPENTAAAINLAVR
ncbi:glycerophosphodiester phosphodiesterase, partial [Streptomyces sp. NPDC047853]